jgi:hypothetical protein
MHITRSFKMFLCSMYAWEIIQSRAFEKDMIIVVLCIKYPIQFSPSYERELRNYMGINIFINRSNWF